MSYLLVNKNSITSAKIIANEDGIIGGLDFADEAFKQIDKKTKGKKQTNLGINTYIDMKEQQRKKNKEENKLKMNQQL